MCEKVKRMKIMQMKESDVRKKQRKKVQRKNSIRRKKKEKRKERRRELEKDAHSDSTTFTYSSSHLEIDIEEHTNYTAHFSFAPSPHN